jgi:spore coat polysaccharide biosynthesis protein SpsF
MNVFIIARMSSNRLPGKILKKIDNDELLKLLIDRIRGSKHISEIVIVTSIDRSDDVLCKFCEKNNLQYYRGSLNNVSQRIINAASHFKVNNFVKILGDNPFIDWHLIDICIEKFIEDNLKYCATATREYNLSNSVKYFPIGSRVQIINLNRMKYLYSKYTSNITNEHSSMLFVNDIEVTGDNFIFPSRDLSLHKGEVINLSVNTDADLDNARMLVKKLGKYTSVNRIIESFTGY